MPVPGWDNNATIALKEPGRKPSRAPMAVRAALFAATGALALSFSGVASAQNQPAPGLMSDVIEAELPQALQPMEETPWYETFTLNGGPGRDSLSLDQTVIDWATPNGDIGVSFVLEDDPLAFDRSDDFAARGYVNFGDRFRFSGQLRFTAPEDLVIGAEPQERAPEVKFESALRF